jgi:hypothetical protein
MTEKERRELANLHRDEFDEDSGVPVKPKRLGSAPEFDDRPSMYEDRLTELRTRAEGAERRLAELEARHREIVDELTEQQALFDLQWQRMGQAAARWRAEAPDDRALSSPDLGRLLEWLMGQIDALAAELAEERRQHRKMADWAGFNVNQVRDMRPVVDAAKEWLAAGNAAIGPKEKEVYDEAGRVLRLAARAFVTKEHKHGREEADGGTAT